MFTTRTDRSYFDRMRRRTILLVAALVGALALVSVAFASSRSQISVSSSDGASGSISAISSPDSTTVEVTSGSQS